MLIADRSIIEKGDTWQEKMEEYYMGKDNEMKEREDVINLNIGAEAYQKGTMRLRLSIMKSQQMLEM